MQRSRDGKKLGERASNWASLKLLPVTLLSSSELVSIAVTSPVINTTPWLIPRLEPVPPLKVPEPIKVP